MISYALHKALSFQNQPKLKINTSWDETQIIKVQERNDFPWFNSAINTFNRSVIIRY